MIITGKEKAFLGGLGAGIVTFAGQLQVGGKLDVKTVGWSLGAWVATHLFVYYTTNTQVVESVVDAAQTPPDATVPPAA
jgi:hypothetical protein